MTSEYVDRTGQDHLPPVVTMIGDPSYQYSRHKHTTEATKDGIRHTYSVTISTKPLQPLHAKVPGPKPRQYSRRSLPNSFLFPILSQISSPTTSELKSYTCSNSKSKSPVLEPFVKPDPPPPQKLRSPNPYHFLGGDPDTVPEEPKKKVPSTTMSSVSTDSLYMTIPLSIPKFTYSSANMKSTRSGKYVMMVQVKFVLLHYDVKHNVMQSSFIDEFASDCLLQDVISSFHELCIRQLKKTGGKFNPRMSYCIGELNYPNSKPVTEKDLKKTLAELAASTTIVQFSLIVNNMD
ncbi:hypothetical protein CAEBREN_03464 [Caenorhabditis brenneri]|uniref:Uncharacterized protein n=1 Tax=Caenorhabditis brenneri TaxID=135651 RepID=G0ME12_CAEBE|nr:hypothetical protein CAEBREN_03464 [Caenorhabditis brenneri]